MAPVNVFSPMSRMNAWSRLPMSPAPPTSGPNARVYPTAHQTRVPKARAAKLILIIMSTCRVRTMPP